MGRPNWEEHIPWFLGVVFTGGLLYSQVDQNSKELEARKAQIDTIAIHTVMLENHQKSLERIEANESANNQEFLQKLDQVINKWDERDATQTKAIQALTLEVQIIKAGASK